MTRYTLPDLPYDPGALEPHLSGRIVELHHGKHHQAYVEGANTTMEKIFDARSRGDFATIASLQQTLAFHVSGHVLHSLYWQNMKPKGGGAPTGGLAQAIDRDFGSFENFRGQLNAVAAGIQGSGWAALVLDPLTRRLGTVEIHDHQSQITQSAVPLLVMDAWEHAYYLQYQNQKADYFDAIWNVWNWEDVAQRFAAAQKLDLGLRKIVEQS